MDRIKEIKSKLQLLDKDEVYLVDILDQLKSNQIELCLKFECRIEGYFQFKNTEDEKCCTLPFFDKNYLEEGDFWVEEWTEHIEGNFDKNKKVFYQRWDEVLDGTIEKKNAIDLITEALEFEYYCGDMDYYFGDPEVAHLKCELQKLEVDVRNFITLSEFSDWHFYDSIGPCLASEYIEKLDFKFRDYSVKKLYEGKQISWNHFSRGEVIDEEYFYVKR